MSSQDIYKRLEIKIRGSRLTPTEIAIATTLILSLNSKQASFWIFRILGHEPIEKVIANVLDILIDLAKRSPQWTIILEKSATKKGRCPKLLKKQVRDYLVSMNSSFAQKVNTAEEAVKALELSVENINNDTKAVEVMFHETKSFLRKSKRTATIRVSTELTNIMHMHDMVNMLSECTPPPDEVRLNFEGVEHVYVPGLVALAAWSNQHQVKPIIENVSPSTSHYLETIGFYRTAARSSAESGHLNPISQMAIVNLKDNDAPEVVAECIVRILSAHLGSIKPDEESALNILFAELVENIQRHAGKYSSAYAAAQVYPARRKLTISVIDTGIGILESFLTGNNEEAKMRILDKESPLQLACAPLVTSKQRNHSGYGLYVTSELVTRNGGTFSILSGNEVYTRFLSGWKRTDYRRSISGKWSGTWIAMILDLNKSVSVLDVYKSLPPPPGIEIEDYFME